MSASSSTALRFQFDLDQYLNPFIPRPRLHLLPKPISRVLGYRESSQPPLGNLIVYVWSFIGAFTGISITCLLFRAIPIHGEKIPIIIGSFGASAILEYNAISSPLAQPRNAMLGQILSSIIGVGITKAFQHSSDFDNLRWLAGALSVATSSVVMGLTNTLHPPAGATALLAAITVEITDLGWYLLPLILLGNVVMLAVACVVNNIQRQFPLYWWTACELATLQTGDSDNEKMATVIHIECLPRGEYAIRQIGGESLLLNPKTLSKDEKEILEALKAKLQI